ncbi:transposase, partial [Psychrobacillus mangrovi]
MAVLSREMREYLVKLVVEDGRKASELAYEYGVKPERIRDWVRVYKQKQALLSDGE